MYAAQDEAHFGYACVGPKAAAGVSLGLACTMCSS